MFPNHFYEYGAVLVLKNDMVDSSVFRPSEVVVNKEDLSFIDIISVHRASVTK